MPKRGLGACGRAGAVLTWLPMDTNLKVPFWLSWRLESLETVIIIASRNFHEHL